MAEATQVGGSELVAWIVAAPIVSMVLCTGGVAARLFTRVRFANQELFLEDWLVIGPAYICIMGVAVAMIVATSYGLGWHTDHGISPADVEKTMKTIYAIQIPLFIAVGAIRTSLLLFIQRLSHAFDIAIFLLPAILVIRLNIKRKKKLQSIVMFALGGGGCIVEGLRFGQIREAETSSDITYTSGVIMIFIFFQVILGMLCCCAPAIKVFAASTFASKFKCTKYFISESSEDVRETDPTRDPPSVARNPEERDLESAPESFYEEASISEAMGWGPSTEGIEMEIQDSDAAKDKQDKSGTVVKERKILNLKEVLELDSQKRAALEVPPGSEGPGSARSGSSGRTYEFQATPVEWGRQL
ncbi:hypothetical protein TWF703_006285 [Orbilia oligospora]|uniref:Rhodopsin domain-containing protein n=1 Tax=Orbilia oligospora TaxID=2813651 RepID=A0A7C8JRV0_ORBOL|nr:hypothetical protein TWF703_006285 [Orbilia oligospora]